MDGGGCLGGAAEMEESDNKFVKLVRHRSTYASFILNGASPLLE